jgi:alkylation response protein AidB-like acyl-CoA dehydrogenase
VFFGYDTSPGSHPISSGPPALGVSLKAAASPPESDTLVSLDTLHNTALDCHGDVASILDLARSLGRTAPQPQNGHTLDLWQSLATLGAADLMVARIIEPHLDALAILDQAGLSSLAPVGSTWGVFAAQRPGEILLATPVGGEWRLNGSKPWCSMAGALSHALLTARTDQGMQLFAIELQSPGVSPEGRPWRAVGLPKVPSEGLALVDVPAVPVGEPGWYVQRPGFSWGGIGVAAIWHGAATALARRLLQHCLSRKPDQIALWHLGSVDQALWSGQRALQAAAEIADADAVNVTHHAPFIAARVRASIVRTAETVLSAAAHGMGPEPLAFEPDHAHRVADLELYLRQDHAERSIAAHGQALFDDANSSGRAPW